MATDNLKRLHASLTSSAENAFTITPSDTLDVSEVPKALLIGVAGNLQVTLKGMATGTSIVLPVPAGYNALRVSRVWNASTTASGIFGLL